MFGSLDIEGYVVVSDFCPQFFMFFKVVWVFYGCFLFFVGFERHTEKVAILDFESLVLLQKLVECLLCKGVVVWEYLRQKMQGHLKRILKCGLWHFSFAKEAQQHSHVAMGVSPNMCALKL